MSRQSTFRPGILIRAATQTDAPVIYDFLCALEETELDWPVFLTIYTQNLANPAIHYRVAEHNREVVGFISCHVQWLLHHGGPVGEIQELFVRPDHRSQRIGHQLVEALHELAVQQQCINLEVTTNQKRLDTIRFYEREAFSRTHIKLVRSVSTL